MLENPRGAPSAPAPESRERWRALVLAALVALGCFGPAPDVAAQTSSAVDALEESDPLFDEEFSETPAGFPDPIQPVNRPILRFNLILDRWVLDPITRSYQFVVPDPARRAIRRVFLNLNSPSIFANDVLQLEWLDAGVTLTRFAINTSIGIGGLFDPAARMGLERHDSDFGQTLSLAGTPSGPYLILPVLGPTTVRDGVGDVVDAFLTPATYFFGLSYAEQLLYGGSSGLTQRDAAFEELKALKSSAVDFYAALHSAYSQNRRAEIWDRRTERLDDWKDFY